MIETEAKFRLANAADAEPISGLTRLGTLPLVATEERDQTDVYWDTPDSEVAESRGSVRVRTLRARSLFTLKLGGVSAGVSRRVEIEEPADGSDPRAWLIKIAAERTLALAFEPRLLEQALQIHNRRRLLHFAGEEGELELALDQVTFSGPAGTATGGELELELIRGAEELLDRAVAELRSMAEMEPVALSKYEQAVRLVGRGGQPG